MVVIRVKDTLSHWTESPFRRELKVLLSPKIHRSSKNLGLGLVSITPGSSGNAHIHETEQETWFILSGTGKLIVGNNEIKLEPEMLVVAPNGVSHQIINDGKTELRALFIFTPAGPEEQFIIN